MWHFYIHFLIQLLIVVGTASEVVMYHFKRHGENLGLVVSVLSGWPYRRIKKAGQRKQTMWCHRRRERGVSYGITQFMEPMVFTKFQVASCCFCTHFFEGRGIHRQRQSTEAAKSGKGFSTPKTVDLTWPRRVSVKRPRYTFRQWTTNQLYPYIVAYTVIYIQYIYIYIFAWVSLKPPDSKKQNSGTASWVRERRCYFCQNGVTAAGSFSAWDGFITNCADGWWKHTMERVHRPDPLAIEQLARPSNEGKLQLNFMSSANKDQGLEKTASGNQR